MESKDDIISKIAAEIQLHVENEGSGHDWWHIYRVWQTAKHIAKEDKLDTFIVETAALLHDIADWKENNLDSDVGGVKTREFLLKYALSPAEIDQISDIVANISFKGIETAAQKLTSLEGRAVWDADKLDAIGAIGIIRCFTFGGKKGMPIHDPKSEADARAFGKRLSNTSIDHFYEKLLLLKDLMFTNTGKKLALGRHRYMEEFLERFYKEWEGEA
jgi:uncharacterized protein